MEMRRFTRLSLLLALAIVFNLIESVIPILNGIIPGVKIGFANVITLFVLYEYGFKDAIYISILRVFLVGILRTGIFNHLFVFSLTGAILSTIVMYLAIKSQKLSLIGVSIAGSITHSIGQIIAAMLLLKMTSMIYYLPWILLLAIPTGILVGYICQQFVLYYENHLK